LADVGINGRIIIMDFKMQGVKVWVGFIWLRIGTYGGLL
jgi:hypothetical protein